MRLFGHVVNRYTSCSYVVFLMKVAAQPLAVTLLVTTAVAKSIETYILRVLALNTKYVIKNI